MALFGVLTLAFTSLGLAATPALADDEPPTVEVDFDAENGDYGDYKISDDQIVLLKPEVIYELSGYTRKQVVAENAGGASDQYFYLRLNGADLEKDITARDGDHFNLCVEVADGSYNFMKTLKAVRLYIAGKGLLNAEGLDVGPTSVDAPTAAESCLCVQDAQIDVTRPDDATTPCVLKGFAELSGSASVSYTSTGDYVPLRVENVGKASEALTLRDSANLFCLHSKRDLPSDTYVDGLQVAGKLVLSDDAHLEAQARPLKDGPEGEGGAAIFCSGDIEIKDTAMLEAYGAGKGVHCMGSLSVSGRGARVDASATDGCGILLELGMNVSDGALVAADGYLAALNVSDDVTVTDAFLYATSEAGTTFVADNSSDISFTVSNSHVELGAAEGFDVFQQNLKAAVDNCWVNVTTGNEFVADITNSVIFIGDQGAVIGDARISYAAEVAEGQTLTIPKGASLTLAPGTTFFNGGTMIVRGNFNGDVADIECVSHCGGEATCTSRAACAVCGAEYGELDPANHVHLAHVGGKAATTAAEGNIEYWYCPDCGKYFSDAACEHEISQADTVIARQPEAPKPTEKTVVVEKTVVSKVVAGKAAGNRLAATGDSSAALAMAAVVLGCAFIAGAAFACRRNA